MPILLPPKILGPISNLNDYVIVQNHKANSTLRIFEDGSPIGELIGAIGGSDQVILSSPMSEGGSITVRQELNGEVSEMSPEPVLVLSNNGLPTKAAIQGVLYDCVEFCRINGLFPGSRVEVHQASAGAPLDDLTRIGEATTYRGDVSISLSKPITRSLPVVIREIAGGVISEIQHSLSVYPLPKEGNKLIQPKILEAEDCSHQILVDNTVNGIKHEIEITAGPNNRLLIGHGGGSKTRFNMSQELSVNEEIQTTNIGIAACDIDDSDKSDLLSVGPRNLDPPQIFGPLCLDTKRLKLINIEPGADYSVSLNYTTTLGAPMRILIGEGQFPIELSEDWIFINRIEIPSNTDLNERIGLDIQQTKCGLQSGRSNAVEIVPELMIESEPLIEEPIYSCAKYIKLSNLKKGQWISIHSQGYGGDIGGNIKGGKIGEGRALDSTQSFFIPIGLEVGDVIWAVVEGCQSFINISAPVEVQELSLMPRPNLIEPIYPSDRFLTIENLTIGAKVIVDVIGPDHYSGRKVISTYAHDNKAVVFVGELFEGDEIRVIQQLCTSQETGNSDTVQVSQGTLNVQLSPQVVQRDKNNRMLVTTSDPSRNNKLIDADIDIEGSPYGKSNVMFSYNPDSSTPYQAIVTVNAPGYQQWTGSISVIDKIIEVEDPMDPTDPPPTKDPSYTYTCNVISGAKGIEFVIKGTDFPPGVQLEIQTVWSGLVGTMNTDFCGSDATGDLIRTTVTDANGTFEEKLKVLFGCQPTCSLKVIVYSRAGLSIIDPPEKWCSCP